MKKWKEVYNKDLQRYGEKPDAKIKKLLKYLRKCQYSSNKISLIINRYLFKRIKDKTNIELFGQTKIGYGLYIGHPYGITINPEAVIGNNCNIHKGVLIGQENRGKRKGTPIIGNEVWIGVNAVIVGKVTIGDDVLIAPNTYVNCDVPPHSVVFGNPCVIKHKDNATEGYINRKNI